MLRDFAKPCHSLEDRGVHNRFLDPRGILPRRVLLGQCQGSVDAVEHVGSDEGDIPTGENVKFDHDSRLCQGGGGVNEGGRRGEGWLLVDMTSAFILLDPRVPFILHPETQVEEGERSFETGFPNPQTRGDRRILNSGDSLGDRTSRLARTAIAPF